MNFEVRGKSLKEFDKEYVSRDRDYVGCNEDGLTIGKDKIPEEYETLTFYREEYTNASHQTVKTEVVYKREKYDDVNDNWVLVGSKTIVPENV